MQGNLLVCNVIGFQGILQYKLQEKGASLEGIEVEPLVSSGMTKGKKAVGGDLNFRPSDVRVGPDGAIYFLDWNNPIIGHMQHNLRDPEPRSRAWPHLSHHLRGPAAAQAHQDLRRADRQASGKSQIQGRSRPLLDADRTERAADERRHRRRAKMAGFARPEGRGLSSIKRWKRSGFIKATTSSTKNCSGKCSVRPIITPAPPPRASCAIGAIAWTNPLELLHTQINDSAAARAAGSDPRVELFPARKGRSTSLSICSRIRTTLICATLSTRRWKRLMLRSGVSKKDRKDLSIGQSLVKMLDNKSVTAERKVGLMEAIARHGEAAELEVLWRRGIMIQDLCRRSCKRKFWAGSLKPPRCAACSPRSTRKLSSSSCPRRLAIRLCKRKRFAWPRRGRLPTPPGNCAASRRMPRPSCRRALRPSKGWRY